MKPSEKHFLTLYLKLAKIELENVIFFLHSIIYSLLCFLPFGRWTVWLPEHQGSRAVRTSAVTDNSQSDRNFLYVPYRCKRSTYSGETWQSLKPKVSSDNKSGRN